MVNKILKVAVASSLSAVAYSNTVSASLATNETLSFDAIGSYMGMDTSGDGVFSLSELISIESTDGIDVNSVQSTVGDIDAPWLFFGNLSSHTTVSSTRILSDDGAGNVTIDFSGWGISSPSFQITLGGGEQDCGTTDDGICITNNGVDVGGVIDNGTGIAAVTCFATCAIGDGYFLNYYATVPLDDISGFGGVSYALHLEGCFDGPVIGGPYEGPCIIPTAPAVPIPAAAWLFGSGLLGLVGMARRKA